MIIRLIVMEIRFSLRLITFICLVLVCLALVFMTNLSSRMIISVVLILLFLMIFTYIFKTDASKTLMVLIILFTFFGLPLFLFIYLDIFNSFQGIARVLIPVILTAIFGFISVFLIIQLDYVELNR